MTLLACSIVLSLIVLGVSCFFAYGSAPSRWKAPLYFFLLGMIANGLLKGSTVVTLQVTLITALIFYARQTQSRWPFVLKAVGLTVASYAAIFFITWQRIESYRQLRAEYPAISMEERLPVIRHSDTTFNLTPETKEELETTYGGHTGFEDVRRELALNTLHRKTMETFVNADGFGVRRIIARPTRENLMTDKDIVIPQPGSLIEITNREIPAKASFLDNKHLLELHRDSLLDFANIRSFGWVKGRAEVYGFQPHFFRAVPKSEHWEVRTIELVSLLLHDEPAVYVTAHLPRMEELRVAPTRELEPFESTGLERITQGETLYYEQEKGGLRLIGAIRSAGRCVACHGGEEGDLLGAFSYALKLRMDG